MITLELVVPSPLPLHANQRLHHAPKAQRVKAIREQAQAAATAAGLHCAGCGDAHGLPVPSRLTVHIGWPDKRRRDAHNAYPTIKAAIDGIVLAGWLDDDDDTRLIGPDLRSYYAGIKGSVVLRFEFEAAA